jgi:uncharacterized protein (TIGR02271 family)
MGRGQRSDRFTEIEDRYAGYEVYDRDGDKIGKVDDLFLDENDQPEYIGVKMGFLGTRSTLIPWEVARVDEGGHRIEVSIDKAAAKEGPAFDDDEEITPEYEERVRSYYGLGAVQGAADGGHYGGYYGEETDLESGERYPGVARGDIDRERDEFREHDPVAEGTRERGGDLDDEDELRVQRTEEELRAGTREREAGSLNVRKRVRTDREQVSVPKRREEVHVERVPVGDQEASEVEIGEDEISVPVTEEEVVTEKRPVVKEEIRLRKDVAHDEEVVEEDVRKEEVDVEDQTERRGASGRDLDVVDDETRRR